MEWKLISAIIIPDIQYFEISRHFLHQPNTFKRPISMIIFGHAAIICLKWPYQLALWRSISDYSLFRTTSTLTIKIYWYEAAQGDVGELKLVNYSDKTVHFKICGFLLRHYKDLLKVALRFSRDSRSAHNESFVIHCVTCDQLVTN